MFHDALLVVHDVLQVVQDVLRSFHDVSQCLVFHDVLLYLTMFYDV